MTAPCCPYGRQEKNYYIANDCIHYDGFYKILNLMFPKFEGAFIGHTSISPFSWCIDVSGANSLQQNYHMKLYSKIAKKMYGNILKLYQNIYRRTGSYPTHQITALHILKWFDLIIFEKANEILNYDIGPAKPLILENGDSIQIDVSRIQAYTFLTKKIKRANKTWQLD